MSRRAVVAAVALTAAVLLIWVAPASAADGPPIGWTVTQITDNISADEWPQIDPNNANIVWQRTLPGHDSEIWAWNFQVDAGSQLTTNDTEDIYPQIYGDAVVWQGRDTDGDWEIYLYRFSTGLTTKLTNNSWDDTQADIYGDLVCWVSSGGPLGDEICAYDILDVTLHRLTYGWGRLDHPQTDGTWVVWQARRTSDPGGDIEIEYWDGTTTRALTNNGYDDYFPQIRGK